MKVNSAIQKEEEDSSLLLIDVVVVDCISTMTQKVLSNYKKCITFELLMDES